jgi:hypothetical protein
MTESRQRVEIRCIGAPVVEIPSSWRSAVSRMEHPEGTAFVLADETLLNDVIQWLIQQGVGLRAVTPQRATLEELFMAAASQGTSDAASLRTRQA